MDWFRRMSERDRLNSILPFFLPAVHVDFTSTSANLYVGNNGSRDFYEILLQIFANQSWIRLKERSIETILRIRILSEREYLERKFAVVQILFHIRF